MNKKNRTKIQQNKLKHKDSQNIITESQDKLNILPLKEKSRKKIKNNISKNAINPSSDKKDSNKQEIGALSKRSEPELNEVLSHLD